MNRQSIRPFGCIVLLAIVSLAATAAQAQSVPATAREAAASPQFAARLAHRAAPQQRVQAGHRGPVCSQLAGRGRNNFLPLDNPIYSNGPINGSADAWTINDGFVVADSFTVGSNGGTVGSLSFGAWLFPGDVVESVQVTITSAPFGGTVFGNQVVSLTQSNCYGNQYGFNVCTAAGNFSGPILGTGTYWVNLENAVVNSGNPVFWDENSGPSSAENNSVGTIPSEAFTLYGSTSGNSCMPEQQGNFKVIHDFTGGADGSGPNGVAVDAAGNVYGAAASGGTAGSVFKMAQTSSQWLFRTLYSFLGGNSGGQPNGVIVGPQNRLYGSANSGNQGCRGFNCGLIFSVSPGPAACLNHACSWMEDVLYNFTGETDAWGGNGLVLDPAGDLYGISYSGGAQQVGAVFELSPTIGGWVENVIYSFTGGSTGTFPTALLFGIDGNLYGLTQSGGANGTGIVFQLAPSGSGWTETVLCSIPSSLYGAYPHSLVQDGQGNLFGEWEYWYQEPEGSGEYLGVIFKLAPSNGSWTYSEIAHGQHQIYTNDTFNTLALDGTGNLWGTGGGAAGCYNPILHGYIFELVRSEGWYYYNPVYWNSTKFDASGALAIDNQGNLYGTTSDCGTLNQGTVWEFSSP